jgi:hypothetical protein
MTLIPIMKIYLVLDDRVSSGTFISEKENNKNPKEDEE